MAVLESASAREEIDNERGAAQGKENRSSRLRSPLDTKPEANPVICTSQIRTDSANPANLASRRFIIAVPRRAGAGHVLKHD